MGGRVGERAGAEFRIRGSGGERDRIGGARAIAAVGFGVEQRAVGGAVELLPVGFGQQRPDAAADAGGDGKVERHPFGAEPRDRKSVVEGKSVSVRVDLGGRRTIKKKKK